MSLNATAREPDFIRDEIEDLREQLDEILKERVTQQVEQRVRHEVRARVRQSIEHTVTENVVDTVIESVSQSLETALPGRLEVAPNEITLTNLPSARLKSDAVEPDLDRLIASQLSRIEREIDLVLDTVQDREGNAAMTNEWLVMTDKATLTQLASEGYLISHLEELSGLGYLLGRIKAPSTFDPRDITTVQVLDSPQVAVDLNHVYLPQRDSPGVSSPSMLPRSLTIKPNWPKIGMIDSSINHNHPVFGKSRIRESLFTPRGFDRTSQHGTAIASILVGHSETFTGISPSSNLYNGVVFATDELGREFSTTAAIVRAINWLVENDVPLINMSLAGPDNVILKRAIDSACARGITLVTAAGNAGPSSPPLYPAAYSCTIAVTAVDNNSTPYHRANRGRHIDYALPGVDIRHATDEDTFEESSGTSFAAAVLSGLISARLPTTLDHVSEVKARLDVLAVDLGQPGHDPVYGTGVIHAPSTARISD